MKNKNKRINWTKRRIWERKKKKALVLIMAVAIGVSVIGINYIQLDTELKLNTISPAMAQEKPKQEKPKTEELSLEEHVWKLLTEEGGLTFNEAMKGMMIIDCESKFDPYAIGDSGKSVGLWQIYKPAHPEISTACRLDVYCSTREALKIYKEWGNWTAWSCYHP